MPKEITDRNATVLFCAFFASFREAAVQIDKELVGDKGKLLTENLEEIM